MMRTRRARAIALAVTGLILLAAVFAACDWMDRGDK